MKKSLFALLVLLLIAVTVMCQTKKSLELLKEGMASNDVAKINKALSKGVKLDDCLLEAIEQNKLNYVEDFINRGANPSNGLLKAVSVNKIDIAKYLLENGARFIDLAGEDIDGQVYLMNKSNPKDTIPITIVNVNNKNRWLIKDEKKHEYLYSKANEGVGYYVKYKTKTITSSNQCLLWAIKNKNLQMVDLLIVNGLDIKKVCIVESLHDFRDNGFMRTMINNGGKINTTTIQAFITDDGYICSTVTPSPALLLRPIEYAMFINSDKSFVDALFKYDSITNYKFDIKKVSCVTDNSNISEIKIISFDYGFTLNFKLKNENIYGYKLAYSTDNVNFMDVKEISYPIDTTNSIFEYNESITKYYGHEFGDKIQDNELILKIIPKEYEIFTDPRDGQKYKTVKIGDYVVMAENFRYKMPSGCWTYDDNESNVKKYGYLYSWDTAMKVAPEGWHLPSAKELEDLFSTVIKHSQFSSQIVKYYEIVNAVVVGGNAGFNMLYCGCRQFGAHKEYNYIGNRADFWSSDTFSGGKAVSATFINPKNTQKMLSPVFSGYSYMVSNSKPIGCSVRLFKDK